MIDPSKLKGVLKCNHSLKEYTSWKIGGNAEYFYCPVDLEDLMQLMTDFKEIPITVLGAATNVLIRDSGIKGLVIYLRDSLKDIKRLDDNRLRVEAGARLISLVQNCIDLGMSDAVFMAGIPGTLGGALKMNAGAYGDAIWNYVTSVETINRLGEIKTRSAKEFVTVYREVEGLNRDEWFLAVKLSFGAGDSKVAKEKMQKYLQKRTDSQPLNLPSCGSVFRNPEKDYAARLIEISGLKGRQIGGARVSEKHANFIVNCGNAKASDVEDLMQEIIAVVKKTSGIELVPEVEIIG